MNKQTYPSRLELVDVFVVASILTIIITRLYLLLTGFPTIGSGHIHIAHVLWGGVLLTIALFMAMLTRHTDRLPIAVVGGVGFGLFIDEVGKFVTHNNDYFYKDAFYLMYLSLLSVWLITRLIIVRQEKRVFLLPAEWPEKNWGRILILIWSLVQIIDSVISVVIIQAADKKLLVLAATLFSTLYLVILVVGIVLYLSNKKITAANILRLANVLCLVFVSPVAYLYSPVLASIGAIGACIAAMALSGISVTGLLRRLLFWR